MITIRRFIIEKWISGAKRRDCVRIFCQEVYSFIVCLQSWWSTCKSSYAVRDAERMTWKARKEREWDDVRRESRTHPAVRCHVTLSGFSGQIMAATLVQHWLMMKSKCSGMSSFSLSKSVLGWTIFPNGKKEGWTSHASHKKTCAQPFRKRTWGTKSCNDDDDDAERRNKTYLK